MHLNFTCFHNCFGEEYMLILLNPVFALLKHMSCLLESYLCFAKFLCLVIQPHDLTYRYKLDYYAMDTSA